MSGRGGYVEGTAAEGTSIEGMTAKRNHSRGMLLSRALEAQGVESRYVSLALGMFCESA